MYDVRQTAGVLPSASADLGDRSGLGSLANRRTVSGLGPEARATSARTVACHVRKSSRELGACQLLDQLVDIVRVQADPVAIVVEGEQAGLTPAQALQLPGDGVGGGIDDS